MLARDNDGAGVGDSCDRCPTIVNADQKDTEHEGVGGIFMIAAR